MKKENALLIGALGMLLVGCSSETLESAKQDVERNTAVVKREAERVEKVTRPVREIARPVTDAVKKEADQKVEQLKLGARVTAALKANENLPETIRVDVGPDARRVTLRGTVDTPRQKRLAERIARQTIGLDKTVQNDLVVKEQDSGPGTQ